MAMVKKSISVTDQQDRWIKAQIQSGHFGNESEVVRELIRERQIREQETQADIEAIAEDDNAETTTAKLAEGLDSLIPDQADRIFLKPRLAHTPIARIPLQYDFLASLPTVECIGTTPHRIAREVGVKLLGKLPGSHPLG